MTGTDVTAGTDLVSISPVSGDVLERFEAMGQTALDAALDAALAAQRGWRATPLAQRSVLMHQLAATLRAQSEPLAVMMTTEMGKPVSEARAEIEKCAVTAAWMADHAAEMLAPVALDAHPASAHASFQPLGVILAIMPWNYPYWQLMRAAIPALLAGNGILLKHAPNVTRSALAIEATFQQAGFPAGLVRTLLIDTATTATVIRDRRVHGVTLTGSVRAGEAVGAIAGGALKKAVLELGGSDPFIVLADADLDATVAAAVRARFQNNGQSCIAAKRFIVEAGVAEPFLGRFVDAVRALAIGDPLDPATRIGPLARADLRDGLQSQLERAVDAGATAATGRGARPGPGWFFEPTILTDLEPGSPVLAEETFGPLAAVTVVANRDEALRSANASEFGLGASVWTADRAWAVDTARDLDAGMVFVNGIVASDARLPFGGIKRSGLGRELSVFGVREFVNVQLVVVDEPPGAD